LGYRCERTIGERPVPVHGILRDQLARGHETLET
jgi:hypothetical protein